MQELPNCPEYGSSDVVKNGKVYNGKQNHRCHHSGLQFVEHPENKVISQETKILIDKLLLEKIPLAGIVRVVDVSEPWLQNYVNKTQQSNNRWKYSQKKGRLIIQCEEMWSFVGVFIGSRSIEGAQGL